MSLSVEERFKVIPAQVGFLAIYNPSLGTSDETIENQLVYYYAQESSRKTHDGTPELSREQTNERLRQIGLAQGMVEFSRNFSNGTPVDAIETEKSRVILHELESGWWILASINLTVLPKSPMKDSTGENQATIEYSSREVKPSMLLLRDLLQAHSTFLLHHASSLSALFVRTKRSKFINFLIRYWDTYISTWNVLMHGSPANNIYGGIKIAASGELGIGVGEEERGSGEREVLEGFVRSVEGLVDIIVSKFGEDNAGSGFTGSARSWLGSGDDPDADDGAIFLGTGALTRKSTKDISHWIQDLYTWGSHAYGVSENPTSDRAPKQPKQKGLVGLSATSPIVTENAGVFDVLAKRPRAKKGQALTSVEPVPISEDDRQDKLKTKHHRSSTRRGPSAHTTSSSGTINSQRLVSYLKLGYGTHWSLGSTATNEEIQKESTDQRHAEEPPIVDSGNRSRNDDTSDQVSDGSSGHYLIGLMSNLDSEPSSLEPESSQETDLEAAKEDSNARISLRTLTVELEREEDARAELDISINLGEMRDDVDSSKDSASQTLASNPSWESQDRNKTKKLRVIVYVHRPFMYVFLFELRTSALALSQIYRSLHTQLAPLHRPLLQSTRFRATLPEVPSATRSTSNSAPIYHLLWDPVSLTIRSTIPNIPQPSLASKSASQAWTRLEALSTHLYILSRYSSSYNEDKSLESTGKTSKGWWVVWLRVSPPKPNLTIETPSITSLSSGQVGMSDSLPGSRGECSSDLVTRPGSCEDPSAFKSGALKPSTGKTRLQPVRSISFTTTTNTSIRSGPAHPFQAVTPCFETRRSMDKVIWLVRKGGEDGSGAAGKLGRLAGAEQKEAVVGRGIGFSDYRGFVEGLLGLR